MGKVKLTFIVHTEISMLLLIQGENLIIIREKYQLPKFDYPPALSHIV